MSDGLLPYIKIRRPVRFELRPPERHARIKNATRTKYGAARGIFAFKRELNSVMTSAIGYKKRKADLSERLIALSINS